MDNNKSQSFFSITIPTYEMNGFGGEFLTHSFEILAKQKFKDFEVIVSDHSLNDEIKNVCERWSEVFNVKYHRNDYKRGGSSPNINTAMKLATGKWIKILFQDDFLYDNKSLENIKNHIDENKDIMWIASACEHSVDGVTMHRPFYPSWTSDIHLGNNRISSPSVITIKNTEDKYFFDEDLIWLMDVEYYRRTYDTYGEPSYLNTITVVNRTWGNSVSNSLPMERKNNEEKIMFERYNK
jgi:glycosyltransferase involved in cell wall biosynthesis